jgi:hypothetical protein
MENETEGGNGKGGTLTPSAQDAIGDAAKANVNAAVELAKSAVSSFVDVFTGERKKPQRGKRRSTRKKVTSKGAASKRGKTRSAAASSRRVTRKSSTRPGKQSDLAQGDPPPLRPVGAHERLRLLGSLVNLLNRSESPRSLAELSLAGPLGAAHAEDRRCRDRLPPFAPALSNPRSVRDCPLKSLSIL